MVFFLSVYTYQKAFSQIAARKRIRKATENRTLAPDEYFST